MVNFFTYSIIALIILDFFALPLACFLDNQIDKINKNKNPMEATNNCRDKKRKNKQKYQDNLFQMLYSIPT